jgi:hypothetical protein
MVSFVAVEPLEAFTDGCAPLICVGVSQTRRQFDKKKVEKKTGNKVKYITRRKLSNFRIKKEGTNRLAVVCC